ncbi:hypothetical protein INT48_003706 [Thamnidium elegans]|uniref:Uncharacterized protein n=1 Tax=Thamnidium elegans TaxID=101142 RepID=A0A8H7SHV4_9FUNG|nr:hypothetical protein INT48_003706 [Thamnidium elegans]
MLVKIGDWEAITLSSLNGKSYHILTSLENIQDVLVNQSVDQWTPPTTTERATGEYTAITVITCSKLLKPMTESINKDWIISLQLRYAVSQLLAGAILIEQYTDILVNCIEPYGRLKSTDARYKRRIATTIHLSSYPKKENKYGWMTIVQVQEDNIAIINNFELNSLLQSLADSLSTSIKDANLNAAKLLEKPLKA